MDYEVIVIGAGAAGMMCAIQAGQRGRRVLLLDHADRLGRKILISGGGRCNFTNKGASPLQYVSKNPHFCKSALSRYSSDKFIQLVESHQIAYHEKKLGQLFCDRSAQAIVDLLIYECNHVGAQFELGCKIENVSRLATNEARRFIVKTSKGAFTSRSLVIATGGLSIPKIGATGLGYEIAEKFGIKINETAPALDGFVFGESEVSLFKDMAGVSIDCEISVQKQRFRENILFTHSGLSGPAALQASLHWYPDHPIRINLVPDQNIFQWLMEKKKSGNRSIVKNLLSEVLPNRFAERFSEIYFPSQIPLPQVSEKNLEAFCQKIHQWQIIPKGTVGYSKAEVTRGGVDTNELSSKTMESKNIPGLYFIGEVVDVTGWLGGYNFQWAWASAYAAASDL